MKRPCLGFGLDRCRALVTAPGGRCPECARRADAARGTTEHRGYGNAWRQRSETIRKEWLATHGKICPGYPVAYGEHNADDLVVDHDIGVLCRACNSRKAATTDKKRARNAPTRRW